MEYRVFRVFRDGKGHVAEIQVIRDRPTRPLYRRSYRPVSPASGDRMDRAAYGHLEMSEDSNEALLSDPDTIRDTIRGCYVLETHVKHVMA